MSGAQRDDVLFAAADELDRRGESLAELGEGYALSRECVELAARLRHAARWLAKPTATAPQPPAAAAPPTDQPLVLTPAEAAELLNLSPRTLARMAEAGELRPLKRGRVVRYTRQEIDRYLAEQTNAQD